MAKLLAENLRERQEGHFVTAEEWNAVVRRLKSSTQLNQGSFSDDFTAIQARRKVRARVVHIQTTETIPPFSIFSGTNESPSVFDEPMLLKARKIGIDEPGPHGLLLTNGQLQIDANTQGVAKIINYGDVTRLKFTGTTPKIGHFVGPEIDGFQVTVDEQYGLVVVGLVDDTTDDKVEVVRSHEPCAIIGIVATPITAYNNVSKILGSGTINIEYRDTVSDELKLGKDPGVQTSPWAHTVFSTCPEVIPAGDIVKCEYVMGVGLVVDKPCEFTSSGSHGFGTPTVDMNGYEFKFLSVASVTLGPGTCRDSTGVFKIPSSGTLTIVPTFVGDGGLDTGTEAADTWYAVHIIAESDNESTPVAGLLSTSHTAPALPGSFDVFRHIGWVRNNSSSDFIDFLEFGNSNERMHCWIDDKANRFILVEGTAIVSTAVDASLLIPPSARLGYMSFEETGAKPVNLRLSAIGPPINGFDKDHLAIAFVPVDASRQIFYEHTASGGKFNIIVQGYKHFI